jgi:hypothetical protein
MQIIEPFFPKMKHIETNSAHFPQHLPMKSNIFVEQQQLKAALSHDFFY